MTALEPPTEDGTHPQDSHSWQYLSHHYLFATSEKNFCVNRTLSHQQASGKVEGRSGGAGRGWAFRVTVCKEGLGGEQNFLALDWLCPKTKRVANLWPSSQAREFSAPGLRSGPRGNLHPRRPLKKQTNKQTEKKLLRIWSSLQRPFGFVQEILLLL